MQQKLPHLAPEIVKFLRKKLPPLEYSEDMNKEEFLNQAIFRGGQRDVLCRLEKIITEQEK